MPQSADQLRSLAAEIVIAHVEHHDTPSSALPALIRAVYQALAGISASNNPSPAQASTRFAGDRKTSAGQTVFETHLICMECGLHMKMLKRHLQTVHNTSPAEYRDKWRLPGDYPMVAHQYAALRSSLAKKSGLGRRPIARNR
jgi:predicted transcriptional regulator